MEEWARSCFPSVFSHLSAVQTRCLILIFDVQCLAIYSLMFWLDPDPNVRQYFMLYLCALTLPTAYLVVFATKKWIRLALVIQSMRIVLVAIHNAIYPIFVTSIVAARYSGTDPRKSPRAVLIESIAKGLIMFVVSMAASFWEPAKLYQIYRLIDLFPAEAAQNRRDLELDLENGTDDSEDVQDDEEEEEEEDVQDDEEDEDVEDVELSFQPGDVLL